MKPKSLIGNFIFGQFYRLEISLFPYFMIRQKYEKFFVELLNISMKRSTLATNLNET